jgi:RNA polymerase sigma-70 factor (ECF subfamily)
MEIDDAAAVARVRSGEKDAFRLLVERHSQTIFRVAFRMMQNEQDAEEIVQDTFLRAYRALDGFESRANFGTWIYRIAVNRCYDLLDQRKTRHEMHSQEDPDVDDSDLVEQLPATDPSPERNLLSSEIEVRVRSAMKQLTAGERTAFVLRHFEGRTVEEIARVLKVREGAAKNRVHRAVQKLRQHLEPLRTF